MEKNLISLCMITKNEEKFLEQCLTSAKGLVDEIIIVDTGSTDNTKEIAAKFGARIFDFKWNDNFSEARNESLKHATKDWILVLDADEAIDKSAKSAIREAVKKDVDGFFLPQLNYTNKFINHPNFIPLKDSNFKGYFVEYIARLFRRSEDIYYQFCVHELVEYSLLKAGKKTEILEVPIHHYQELKGLEYVDKKQRYYMSMLKKNIDAYPGYAVNYDQMAIMIHTYEKNVGKAIEYVRKAIELEPDNIDYRIHLSCLLNEIKEYKESITCLNEALEIQKDERIYRILGLVYWRLGRLDEALSSYQEALNLGTPLKETVINYIENIKKQQGKSVSYSFSVRN